MKYLITTALIILSFNLKAQHSGAITLTGAGSLTFSGISFVGTDVTVLGKTVQVGDKTGEIANRDSLGNWHIKDTLSTVKQLYTAVEVISKYEREEVELRIAALQIVEAYRSGNKTDLIKAYKHYNFLNKRK